MEFVDLHAQYLSIKSEIDSAIASVIRESAFIRGDYVERFEELFAAALGARHCVSCANGTDAIYIALRALGVKPGDEVITPAHGWIASSETITQAGGTAVFCDTADSYFTIDPERIEAKITERTKGIIAVHLYGQPAQMDRIMAIARRHGLWVIEDCAQAHLASVNGETVGTIGDVGTFSFYPSKNLGAMGDGGALITNRSDVAEYATLFARHGGKNDHKIEGINSRLDGMQAAVLCTKLPHLARWTERRRELAALYDSYLADAPGILVPRRRPSSEHVFHLYVVRSTVRDALRTELGLRDIPTLVNYPKALPFYPAYARFGHVPADFPTAFRHQAEIISLPLYPELSDGAVELIASAVSDAQRTLTRDGRVDVPAHATA